MTTESGHLASIAAVGVAAGFSIMLVYHATPGQRAAVAPVAAAPAANTEQPPYAEGSARLMTQSVLGRSSSAIDPSSYRPAPQPDPGVAVVAVPVPGRDDGPVPVAVTGVGEGEPRLVEPDRIIEGGRPLVERQVEASTRAALERERIGRVLQREADRPLAPERREWRPGPVVRPIERREERRVFAGGGARPILGQGPAQLRGRRLRRQPRRGPRRRPSIAPCN